MGKVSPGEAGSEAAKIDRSRARAAAAFDDTLAAIDGRTAVIAVVAGNIELIAGLRRRGRERLGFGGIADDRGWRALHNHLRE
jgi:hypothetical protein